MKLDYEGAPSLKPEESEPKLRKKRAVNGGPLQLYVEYLMVSDAVIFNRYMNLLQTSNSTIVIQYLQIFFTQLINAVNLRYINSFKNDPDLRIFVIFKGLLIETVS